MRADVLRRPTLAIAAGATLALALPGPGLLPLVLLTPGLFRRALAGVRGWRAFRLGWLAGTAQWLAAVPWVTFVLAHYGRIGWLLAGLGWLLMSAILGLTWAVAGCATTLTPEGWRPWLVPLALAAAEVVQANQPWNFPWNPVAAVATAWPTLLRPLPIVGAIGLSLLVLLVGGALDAVMSRELRRAGAVTLCLALAVSGLATWLAPPFRPAGPAVETACVQPDVPLEERWDTANEAEIEARVWRLSAAAGAAGARWIIWPESAVPRLLERDGAYRAEVERFTRADNVWLLLGSIGFGRDEDEYFNSVYSASPAGILPFRYDKVHLVPFGEYVPLVGRLALMRPLVHEVGSFTPGVSRLPLPSPAGPVGVAVCYEVAFPGLYASEVRRGAEVLATITNDGWYGDTAAPRQHLALAILRAAENRRFLVRAANTGISAIVDPYGKVTSRLEFGRQGFIREAVTPGTGVTPAAAWGAEVRGGMVLCAAGAILFGARRRRDGGVAA